jgi:hypothetical protein
MIDDLIVWCNSCLRLKDGALLLRFCRISALLLLAVAGPASLVAGTITLDFEAFSDSTSLTTQYPGVIFSDATVITAGITLNEFEFPPHSGSNVVFDDGGPISFSFATPVLSFGGYFTYAEPLTLAGFNATTTQAATTLSAFSSNLALSGELGSTPNEFLQVSFAGGISSVTITADLAGGSFALDDATYTTTSGVPEPGSLFLFLIGAAGLLVVRRRLL